MSTTTCTAPCGVRVDRCVCAGVTFAELIDRARREGLSLPQLTDATGATRGCGMCSPYVCEALRSGQPSFDRLLAPVPTGAVET